VAAYKELVILIAEDDDEHAKLIQDGLVDAGVKCNVLRFLNGAEIFEFLSVLSRKGVNGHNQNYLLLLDINMPKMDGIEVLRRMKVDAGLKEIPVVMLTANDDPKVVETCYQIGCNLYVVKPVEFVKFAETIKKLGLFIQVVKI
jgi:CheY-like chemotaxis protein